MFLRLILLSMTACGPFSDKFLSADGVCNLTDEASSFDCDTICDEVDEVGSVDCPCDIGEVGTYDPVDETVTQCIDGSIPYGEIVGYTCDSDCLDDETGFPLQNLQG